MIELLFHLLNFMALIAVGYYFFKRYAMPSIRQEIAFEKLQQMTFQKRCNEVKRQREHFEIGYQRQEEMYQELAAKMQLWREVIQQRMHYLEAQHMQTQKIMYARREQQIHDQHMHELQVRAMPDALKLARQELKVLFASPEKDRQYRVPIIDYMRKVIS